MKIASVRSDIVVFGGGLAGVCASIAAAREGSTVSLVERNYFLGGRAGVAHRFPLNEQSARSWVYSRNSGILDELWHQMFKYKTE
jgi:heterodisulfide reductase subunit A-like polyferredoxin